MTDSTKDSRHSRRHVVGGLSAGMMAAAATPVIAQSGGTTGVGLSTQSPATAKVGGPPANPVGLYPKGPFPKQQQPWPGLASKMDPRPDHGEQSYKGSGRLDGRKALVTGGDSGIGRAAVIAFAREGADVAFNYLPQEEPDAREVVDLIQAAGRKAFPLPGDIRDENFCKQLVNNAAQSLGGLDILVNNAARQKSANSITDISTEDFDWTFKTNVYAMFWITKAAMAHLQPGAAIINTASINAYDPGENIIDYAATKGAIMIFTKGLAKQLAPKGIRVNAVAPGPFWTALQISGGQSPDKLEKFGLDSPIGRPGQPAELAAIYVLLASGEASYSTGQVFAAVGGRGGP
ncbi:MAG: SDR family oxidoreductase [Pseudolabrys sp.]|nr:SDR family oxidoreductase [Pseudolabrys sp.]